MSQQHDQNQKRRPNDCSKPIRERCRFCPFSTTPLPELRDEDYWYCIQCQYRDFRFNELMDAEHWRAGDSCITGIRLYVKNENRREVRLLKLKEEDAKDAAQEYCLKLFQQRHRWNGSPLQPWFNKILMNTVIDHCRKIWTSTLHGMASVEFREPDEDKDTDDPIDILIVREAPFYLDLIKNEKYRSIIAFDLQGIPAEEIARRLRITKQAVYVGRNRALEKIRGQLGLE